MSKDNQTYELLLHASDKGLDELVAVSFEAEEGMSRPYLVTITAKTIDPTDLTALDPGSWLRKKLAVGLARGGDPTWLHGIVQAVEHVGADEDMRQLYRLELGPALALLKHTRRTRVFVDQKPLEVVRAVLQEGGVSPLDFKATGAIGQAPRHITQFEESDFAFVSRLLEQEGAAYWFTHAKTAHTMVVGDSAAHHPGTSAAIKVDFVTAPVDLAGGGTVTSLSRRHEIVSANATVTDYSEGHPKQAASGQKAVPSANAPGAGGKHGEADYHVTLSDGDATTYANRIADRMLNRACRLIGSSGALAFRAGARIAVDGKDGYDEQALLLEVSHSFRDDAYRNTFSAMPVSRLPWRPLRTTPIPRIDGVVPALVTATAGDQGGGEDGAYRVKLLNGEDAKDRVVRMAQPYAGPAQGVHFPLPANTEVLLAHEFGHPDRPIIAGALHNVEDPSPVKDANKTQCVVKSAAGAMLVFEDKQDEEKTTLQSKAAAKLEMDDKPDDEKVVLQSKAQAKLEMSDKPGEEKITLQSKAGHTLLLDDKSGSEKAVLLTKGSQKLEFDDKSGSEKVTLYCKKDREEKIEGKSDSTITGKTSIDCQDEIELKAASKITLKVGGNSITISSSKIEISCTGAIDISSSGGDVSVSGLNAKISGQVGAKVSGNAQAELSASGQTTVKGAIVMIN